MEINEQEWEIDNRAVWENGEKPKTKRILQVMNKYDLSKEFPASNIRPVLLKSIIAEILWIFQRQSNNINDLKPNIWNSWADENGSIGLAYAYQISKPMMGFMNQIDYVLGTIQSNPTSRRIMTNMFNVEDMLKKNLIECAYGTHISVKDNKVNLTLLQRSNDFITANNWNVVGYAILTHMIAGHCGLEVGTFAHFVQDMHIYNKHQQYVQELLDREPRQAPKLIINHDVKNFYDFTVDDFKLEGYNPHSQIKGIEVAI
jgi:thymidylate synthase